MSRPAKEVVEALGEKLGVGETEAIMKAGQRSPADPLATPEQREAALGAVDPEAPAPEGFRTPERNINLDRIDAPEEIGKMLDAVSQSTQNAGYREVSFDEMREMAGDADEEQIMRRLFGGDINKDGLLTGPQLNKARQLMVNSSVNMVEAAQDIAARSRRNEVTDMELIDFQRMVYRHVGLQSAVQNQMRETARSLSFLRDIQTPMSSLQLEQTMMQAGGGRETILARASAIANASEGKEGLDALEAATKAARGSWFMDMAHKVVSWRTVQLLSSPRTHIRNIVGNSITAMLAPIERSLGAAVSKVPGVGSGEIQAGEAIEMYRALMETQADAFVMAYKAFKNNDSAFGAPKIEEQGYYLDRPEASGPPGSPMQKMWDMFMLTTTAPGRALMAEDEYFKTIAFRSQLRTLAYRQAKREGLEGEVLQQRVDELVSGPNQQKILDKVRQGYVGGADDMEFTKEFEGRLKAEEKLFYDMYKESVDFARYQTFTDPAVTAVGQSMERVMRNPLARIIVPFYRTPANILAFATERSPLAVITPQWHRDIQAGGARRDMAIARFTMGSATSGLVYGLVSSGMVTGSGPPNNELRKTYEEAGWRPYSIKVGGEWVSYQGIDPFSLQLAAISNMADAYRYATNDKQRENIAMIMAASLGEAFKERSFLEGFSGFIEALSDADKGRVPRFFASLPASAVPLSGLMRTTSQTMDGVARETVGASPLETAWNEVRKIVPVVNEQLPPKVRPLGDDWQYDEPFGPDMVSPFFSPHEVNHPEIATEMAVNAARIPRVYPTIDVPGTGARVDTLKMDHPKGNEWVYYELQKLIGSYRKQAIDALIQTNGYKDAPIGAADDTSLVVNKGMLLRKAIQAGTRAGKEQFIQKYQDQILLMIEQEMVEPSFTPDAPTAVRETQESVRQTPNIGF